MKRLHRVRLYYPSGLLVSITLTFIFFGCTPNPELARRYANNPALPDGSTAPILSVGSVANTDSGGDGSKSAASSPSGTSIRVALSDPKASQVADIKKALDNSGGGKVSVPDLTALKRTIILTIAKGAYRPADQLVNVTIRITPINFIFTDVTNFKTDYASVDIAKLDLSRNNATSVSVSPPFAGSLLGTGQVGLTTSNTLDEQASLSVRPEILNVSVEGRDLAVYREADRGTDLAGNTLINLSVRPRPPYTIIQFDLVVTDVALASKDGNDLPPQPAPNDAEKVSITTELLRHLRPDDFVAEVSFKYVKRHVLSGNDTYAEYRQAVEFETGQCILHRAVVIPAVEVDVPLWAIWSSEHGRRPVYISDELGPHPLEFTDPLTADRMAHWMMRQKATQIGSHRLSLAKLPGYGELGGAGPYPVLEVGLASARLPQPRPSSVECADGPVISAAD